MCNQLIKLVFAVVLCISTVKLSGQLNLKIGYNLNYSPYTAHNTILSDFNDDRDWLADGFTELHFSNGLQLGARIRGEFVGLDFTWERSTSSKSASGLMPDQSNFSKELNYAINRLGLGLESYNKYFGIGANVYFERFAISSPIQNIDSDEKIVRDDRVGNRIYLIFTAPGSEMLSLSFQPYMAIPWSHHNLSPLARNLQVDSDRGFIQENLHFGFSIVFYNGAQRN